MGSGHLFVYGTLRRETGSEMHRFLARYSEFLGDATLQGKLYSVGSYPGLAASDNRHDVVYGEVYKLRHPDFVLSLLDGYEECGPRFPEPVFMRRKQSVKLNSGDVVSAWVYIFARPTQTLQLIQSGDFLRSS